MELLSNWIENGGSPTLKALTECKPELIEDIIEYLKDIPVYDMVSVGGQDFFLSHSGLANFENIGDVSIFEKKDICIYELAVWEPKIPVDMKRWDNIRVLEKNFYLIG